MHELAGRVALVTGGGRGIGRAMTLHLAAAHVAVAIVARSIDEVNDVAREVIESGGQAIAFTADLGESIEIDRILRSTIEGLGTVDILVNNAATVGPLGRFSVIDPEEWAYAAAVNLLAPIRLTRALLPSMLASGWGRIVNVSSGAVNNPKRDDSYNSYIATKAGLEGHTLNLAAEVAGSGVTVNALRPGIVDTAMQTFIRSQDPDRIGTAFHQRFVQRYQDGQLNSPDVPAKMLLAMLASDQNGEILHARRP